MGVKIISTFGGLKMGWGGGEGWDMGEKIRYLFQHQKVILLAELPNYRGTHVYTLLMNGRLLLSLKCQSMFHQGGHN